MDIHIRQIAWMWYSSQFSRPRISLQGILAWLGYPWTLAWISPVGSINNLPSTVTRKRLTSPTRSPISSLSYKGTLTHSLVGYSQDSPWLFLQNEHQQVRGSSIHSLDMGFLHQTHYHFSVYTQELVMVAPIGDKTLGTFIIILHIYILHIRVRPCHPRTNLSQGCPCPLGQTHP